MKWVTRERARVDRIACPWLITRFIDAKPEFLFVPNDTVRAVAQRENAIPYDIPGVELGHHGAHCSFDAFIERYELSDPALTALAPIVRGADTDDRALTPESAGLYAAATGFQATSRDDFDNMWSSQEMSRSVIESSGGRSYRVPPRAQDIYPARHSRSSKYDRLSAHPSDHRRVARIAATPAPSADPVSPAHHAVDRGAHPARAPRLAHGRDRRAGAVRCPRRPGRDHVAHSVRAARIRPRTGVSPPRRARRDRRPPCCRGR